MVIYIYMLIKKQKKTSIWILIIIFLVIFYYMLRLTTLVEYNNGIWDLEFFSISLNEIYKITTPISFTSKNVTTSLGVAIFALMVYETYRMQNKKNIQENTYRFSRMDESKRYRKKER